MLNGVSSGDIDPEAVTNGTIRYDEALPVLTWGAPFHCLS